MENRKLEILKKVLENASEIQNDMNVFNSCHEWWIEPWGKKICIVCRYHDYDNEMDIDTALSYVSSMFILKGRNLKSGLSSPMARYHAWNYINKHEPKTTPKKRTYVRRHKKGER